MDAPAPRFVFTDRSHGDLAVGGASATLEQRRFAVAPGPWTWLRQEHGAQVVVATEPGEHAGARADAALTAVSGVVVAVHTADCGPLVLVADGAVAVVHAGWRGLLAGVVERSVAALESQGRPPRAAVLGPTIRPHHYEFGPDDLDVMTERFGPGVRATSAAGNPALDLGATIDAALAEHGIALTDLGGCTACSGRHWSHRARGDRARQAVVAWLDPAPGGVPGEQPPQGRDDPGRDDPRRDDD